MHINQVFTFASVNFKYILHMIDCPKNNLNVLNLTVLIQNTCLFTVSKKWSCHVKPPGQDKQKYQICSIPAEFPHTLLY